MKERRNWQQRIVQVVFLIEEMVILQEANTIIIIIRNKEEFKKLAKEKGELNFK